MFGFILIVLDNIAQSDFKSIVFLLVAYLLCFFEFVNYLCEKIFYETLKTLIIHTFSRPVVGLATVEHSALYLYDTSWGVKRLSVPVEL